MSEVKKCPFCGADIKDGFDIYPFDRKRDGKTVCVVNHFCDHENSEVTVCVTAYGNTREEAIAQWNRRAADVQEHITD